MKARRSLAWWAPSKGLVARLVTYSCKIVSHTFHTSLVVPWGIGLVNDSCTQQTDEIVFCKACFVDLQVNICSEKSAHLNIDHL